MLLQAQRKPEYEPQYVDKIDVEYELRKMQDRQILTAFRIIFPLYFERYLPSHCISEVIFQNAAYRRPYFFFLKLNSLKHTLPVL
jgi:hypothetical protein